MWQCKFCNYTSVKKWNVQLHEKRKHSTKIENLNNEVKNNQINNTEIKVEDAPLLVITKPAHKATIKNPMISALRNINIRNDLHPRFRLKKMADLLPKKESPSLRMKRKQKRKIIQDCCSSLSKIIKELKKIEPTRRRVGDWLSYLIRNQYNV